jgi:hypothetical protein
MSETEKKTIVVNRNELDNTFGWFKILKGKRAGVEYPAPVIAASETSILEFTKWAGASNVSNMLQTLVKRMFQSIMTECVNKETGEINWDLFLEQAKNFTTAGLKLAEINDKLDELMAQFTTLVDSSETDFSEETQLKLRELNSQIKAYKQMKLDRSRKPKEDEDEPAEPSVPA